MSAAKSAAALAAVVAAAVVACSGALVTPAFASTATVTNCDDSGSGSLRDAISSAGDGDTIDFGLDCTGANKIVLASQIDILPASAFTLTIDGTGHDITISGHDSVRIFRPGANLTLTLNHLTLTHGKAATGGAIQNAGDLAVVDSTLSNNTQLGGNGGGAVSTDVGGTLTVQESTFAGNSTQTGTGGAITSGGPTTISDSTFSGNSSASGGGGAIQATGTLTIDRSTFTGNSGTLGGAIRGLNDVTVRNSTITGNTGTKGGGIYTTGGQTATLQNDTIADNTVSDSGGGIYNEPSNPATVTVSNSIVSDSSASACAGTAITDGGYNLQAGGDTTCGFSDHNVTTDPQLGALANNGGLTETRALPAGSSAIGAGSATVCQAAGVDDRDQRGHRRYSVARGSCDIGAYDTGAGPPSAATTIIDRSPSSIVADGVSTATITVRARDASGTRLRVGGANVVLQTTKGTLSSPVTDNGNGTYTATLTSGTVAGTAVVTGTINGQSISAQAGVVFTAGPPSGSTTTITGTPRKILADGVSVATITVQAKDQYGNVIKVGGATVLLNPPSAGSLGSVSYVGGGKYQATLRSSSTAGRATIGGTINGSPIAATTTVAFVNASVTSCADSGPGTLRALVGSAESGSTIVFAQDCSISLTSQIVVAGTTLTIDGSGHAVTIDGGHATRLFSVSGTLTLVRLTLANGRANGDIGGAINNGGTLTVRDSTFTGNQADQGGGIENGGTATVVGSTFSGNSANYGGGIKNTATLTIDNSTFVGNDGGGASGALDNQSTGTITVANSTFAGNTSSLGGLIYNQGFASFSNTIVSGTGQCAGPAGVTNGGNTLQFGDTSCGFSITADPLLGSLASNGGPTQTMALGEGSPAIGAGNATVCQAAGVDNVDQRGRGRRADARGRCDIGAYDTRGYVAGPLSAAKTTIKSSSSAILADGSSTTIITVKAKDGNGIPYTTGGAIVTLDTTAGSLSSVTDNGDGTYTATLTSSSSPAIATISGTINSQPITSTAKVQFA